MLATLQFWIKAVLTLGVILGLIFMITCTFLVIICVIRGDIKINIIRSKDEKAGKSGDPAKKSSEGESE